MSKTLSDFAQNGPARSMAEALGVALRVGLLSAIALAGGFAARLLI
jgi:hypothetical protein